MPDDGQERGAGPGPLGQAAGLARIGAAAWWRTSVWTAEKSARLGARVARAAASGQPPAELFRSGGEEAREYARRVLGVEPGEVESGARGRSPAGASGLEPSRTGASRRGPSRNGEPSSLRDRGAELLRRSADVELQEDAHPAYARILEQLAPDEGRVLRLLALEGPQPSVDVRSGLIPLSSTTELVAPGLNMIGEEAGCRHLDDVPAYLNNLFRLGLTWFSREPLPDPLRYQVLEAQPVVTDALASAPRTRTVRRSVELTPLGRDFCRRCLPLETAELEALDAQRGAGPEDLPADPGQPDG
ncbi:MAG: Abi-alpha family protein [Solirubrobacterales bacterium]